jgi:thioredoxin reductase (NADPH)
MCSFACENTAKQRKNADKAANAEGTFSVNKDVASTFKQQFPKAQDVAWDSTETGLAATFTDGTAESKAYFDKTGVFQYLTTLIEISALPPPAQRFLKEKYKDAQVAVVKCVKKEQIETFQVELEASTDYVNLEFDADGKILKEQKLPLSTDELKRKALKKNKNMIFHDVLIIGAGPIGLACGLAAKRAGLNYVIVEKGTLVNSLYNYPLNMSFFSTSDRLEIGEVPFVSLNAKPNRNEALEYYRRVADSNQLTVNLFETVESVEKYENTEGVLSELKIKNSKLSNTTTYSVTTDKRNYWTRNIIIACGFYDIPTRMNIVGEDLPKVTHYYKEPHFYYNQNVVVVGANNSAADAALETYRKGARVTMVIRGSEVGHRVKYWARPDIVNRIAEGSIKAFFNSKLSEIRQNQVDIDTPEGIVTIENDFVIAATGYQPNFSFLEKIGIELSIDGKFHPKYDHETQETNLKGIYLAGVVCGGMDTHVWFIENSRVHAETIINQIKEHTLINQP